MDAGGISLSQRGREGEDNVFVGIQLRRYTYLHIQWLDGHYRIVRLTFLLLFLLFFLPVGKFLLLRLHSLGVWFLREDFLCRIGLVDQHSRTVGHAIGNIHQERVLIHQRRVLQPVSNRIFFLRSLYQESILRIKVESLDLREDGIPITKEKRETIGFQSLRLEEGSIHKWFGECPEHDIVWQEMSIFHLVYRLDVQGIHPRSVLSDIRFAGWHNDVVRESYLFTLLAELIVAIHILQGINAIRTWCHALDDKATTAVGAAHSKHRLGTKCRVSMVGIKPHQYSLDRFEVF